MKRNSQCDRQQFEILRGRCQHRFDKCLGLRFISHIISSFSPHLLTQSPSVIACGPRLHISVGLRSYLSVSVCHFLWRMFFYVSHVHFSTFPSSPGYLPDIGFFFPNKSGKTKLRSMCCRIGFTFLHFTFVWVCVCV